MSMKQTAVIAISVAVLASSVSAQRPVVDEAKAQCLVGEQADGYIGIVDGADVSTEVRRELRDINQERRAFYAELAARNGVPIDATAAATAEKLINDADPGECVQDANGTWIQR